MPNPIINVIDTIWIGTDDGGFVQYETPLAMNSRGIISAAFFGGEGDKDLIPSLSEYDFKVIRTVWRQMCQTRGAA